MNQDTGIEYECKNCRFSIPHDTKECPSCGINRKRRPIRLVFWLLATAFLILTMMIALIGGLVGAVAIIAVLVPIPALKLMDSLFMWSPVAIRRR